MKTATSLSVIGAAALGFAFAAYAGEMTTKKGEPSSVSESAPDRTGKEMKGKAGVPTMPSKGPASVSESAPDKAGKEPATPSAKSDSKKMANPKTPSSVDESSPTKGKGQPK
jgi:hypothetical protein